jgi:phage tail sheath protein FI
MAEYKTPGVYIEEVSIFPPSITSVATAIPAFIGYTTQAPGTIARISSMNEYVANFGGPKANLQINLTNPAAPAASITGPNFFLYYAMQMYFANGGGPCYVISTGNYPGSVAKTDFALSLSTGPAFSKLILEDEPTLIVMPELTLLGTAADAYEVQVYALQQAAKLQDRFVLIDVHPTFASPRTNVIDELRFGVGTSNLKYGAAYYPDLVTSMAYPPEAVSFTGSVGLNSNTMAYHIANPSVDWLGVEKKVREVVAAQVITLPPSAAIAGIYASVDRDRGVWKAPANVSINGVSKPSIAITRDQQDLLNVDSSGKSVNAIRTFTGKGTLVWGARTLAGNDNEWRYVPVRRLFIMVEESIKKATEFVVFEPNDANTWLRVKTMIENFLLNLWKDGALAGAVPKDAFFVKVGLNQTMTAQDILEGRLIIEIGMAAVRPAEFIILKFSHKLQES